jgi:hypothetical protein
MQGNRPRACRLRAVGAGAEQRRRTGDAIKRGGPAGSYVSVLAVSQRHTCVSRGDSVHEQEDPEVREGVGTANQFGPIGFSHESMISSSSYSSLIILARPQHLKKAPGSSYRASLDPFAETSSPWQSRLSSPRITVRNTSPVILNPPQSLANFFVTHGTSPLSSSSHHQSCSPREFTSHSFSSTTKATPRFALIH